MKAEITNEVKIEMGALTYQQALEEAHKIGRAEGVESGKERWLEAGKVLGRSEVVDWIQSELWFDDKTVGFKRASNKFAKLWSNKLKEWGIKEE